MFFKRVWYAVSNTAAMIPIVFLAIVIHEISHGVAMLILQVPIEQVTFGLPFAPQWHLVNLRYASGEFVSEFSVYLSPWLIMAGVRPAMDYLAIPPIKGLIIALIGPLLNLWIGFGLARLGTLRDLGRDNGMWNFFVRRSFIGSWRAFLVLFTLWNINLGILNILPIPPLDGGKAMISLIGLIQGHPMNEDSYLFVSLMGLLVLAVLWVMNLAGVAKFFFGKK